MSNKTHSTLSRCGVWSLLLWLAIGAAPLHAELAARLERDRIAEGETVRLLVEAPGRVAGQPDTGPLSQDFEVLGVASGSQVNIINGRMDARTTWTITLSPKRAGALTIPPLQVGDEQSPPLTLQVSDAPVAADAAAGSPLFIETELDAGEPYVQGMVRYKARLFIGAKLADGTLSDPQPDNALVRRLGEDRKYTLERAGRQYNVVERSYAVFPQVSGELVIPAPVLDARVVNRASTRRGPLTDFFGSDPFGDVFATTRPVRVRGEARTLTVKPRPAQASGTHWLPAEQVELAESWQPEAGEIRVGEPLTRTLTLRARGLTGEQLPDLAPARADGFKVYPDRAAADTRDDGRSVLGERVQSIAFVPTRAGRFTLPAIQLHWWDTQSDRERTAELPPREVEVLPPAGARGAVAPADVAQPMPAADAEAARPGGQGPAMPPRPVTDAIATAEPAAWRWSSLVFAVLWLATLGLWWRERRRQPSSQTDAPQHGAPASPTRRKLRQAFAEACAANDPVAARRRLLAWAAAHWPDAPPRGLTDLAGRLDDKAAQAALAELDRVLYSGSAQDWSGRALAGALTRLPKPRPAPADARLLPDLYG